MPRKKDNRHIVSRPVNSLKPYPLQAEMFGDLSQPELDSLAADIKKNGLRDEIEILPSGTIIAGHQRLRAVKLLGWKKVDCWIRDDLAEQGEVAIEGRFIEDNLNRRHLTKLAIARAYLHLRELQQEARTANDGATGDGVITSSGSDVRLAADRLAKCSTPPECSGLSGRLTHAVLQWSVSTLMPREGLPTGFARRRRPMSSPTCRAARTDSAGSAACFSETDWRSAERTQQAEGFDRRDQHLQPRLRAEVVAGVP
jgi:hypothetical protein